jgi:hypothetical protein
MDTKENTAAHWIQMQEENVDVLHLETVAQIGLENCPFWSGITYEGLSVQRPVQPAYLSGRRSCIVGAGMPWACRTLGIL